MHNTNINLRTLTFNLMNQKLKQQLNRFWKHSHKFSFVTSFCSRVKTAYATNRDKRARPIRQNNRAITGAHRKL